MERFLVLALSKVEANAVNAGDLPLTRARSGLKDMLLERCDSCPVLLPECAGVRRFGF